jgi:hypothetical protein
VRDLSTRSDPVSKRLVRRAVVVPVAIVTETGVAAVVAPPASVSVTVHSVPTGNTGSRMVVTPGCVMRTLPV